jgi:uncharacterized membrane protein YdjX (TVP38/TMEM64 family)
MQPVDQSDAPESPAPYAGRSALLRRVALAALTVGAVALLLVAPDTASIWEAVQKHLGAWQEWSAEHTLLAVAAFFLAYAVATALPLPVLTIMSLLAGALFGRTTGTAVAALAYTAGVTVAFLAARWLLRERVQRNAGPWLARIERGVARDGAFYLLTLRLMPSVPFFLVNMLMALTPMRTRTYALVSWLGVLPTTFLYAGVGTELADLKSPSDVLSVPVIASLVALAVVPLVVRKFLRRPEPEAAA